MFQQVIYNLLKKFPSSTVYAHCDVPCGIYDPNQAMIAAETVKKMVEKIIGISSTISDDKNDKLKYQNSMTRYILAKEEHARKCKEEILILWTDYFKNEHLSLFPDLHETFWNAAKLCSKNKQEISQEAAEELVQSVKKIAEMFAKTKQK